MSFKRELKQSLQLAIIKFLENLLSKKFTVFIVATALLVYRYITPTEWMGVALALLGVVSAIDFKYGTRKLDGDKPADEPTPSDIAKIP